MSSIIRVSPTRCGDFLLRADIPWQQLSLRMLETRAQDLRDLEIFDCKQHRIPSFSIRVPLAPCPYPAWPISHRDEPPCYEPENDESSASQSKGTGLPFKLRHRFLNWLVLLLEATFADRAQRQGVQCANMDMTRWKCAFLRDELLKQGYFNTNLPYTRESIYEGAEAIRHAAEHRRDIDMAALKHGMSLPALFGDKRREDEINRVYELVWNSVEPDVSDDTLAATNVVFSTIQSADQLTMLYSSLQYAIEAAMFRYTEEHRPELLDERGWTEPEQVEMPRWEEAYRGYRVVQDAFPDEDGNLFNSCLSGARYLRNNAAHRNTSSDEGILNDVHNSIRCLITLRDQRAAIEAEILAEQWFAKTSRIEVLQRLRGAYLEPELPSEEQALMRRREERRRGAIAEILKQTSSIEKIHHEPSLCPGLDLTHLSTSRDSIEHSQSRVASGSLFGF